LAKNIINPRVLKKKTTRINISPFSKKFNCKYLAIENAKQIFLHFNEYSSTGVCGPLG
jgi:hypothetical protein